MRDGTSLAACAATAVALAFSVAGTASAQQLTPEFASSYSIADLGAPAGVPLNLGGLAFKPGDPNTLYIGGAANSMLSKMYAVPVTRDPAGHIVSFGAGVEFCAVNGVGGGIDGGVEFGPGGVLFYVTYPDNTLGQVKPGSVAPDRITALGPVGVASSTGALRFVPAGFPGAGRLKIASYSQGFWYDTTIVAQGDGTYLPNTVSTGISIGGGPEGIVYIHAGSPHFSTDSVLVSEYGSGQISTYQIDANGDPIPLTRRTMLTGLGGAEGAVQDPVSGDYLFSTFGGGNHVIAIRGFAATVCEGDLDGSGSVDAADLAVLLGSWGASCGSPADLDGSCTVDAADLAVLLGSWGPC